MNVTLELSDDLEPKVKAHAEARGVPVDRFLQSVIEAAAISPVPASSLMEGTEEHERLLDELASGLAHVPALSEAAFNRESIYADHD